MKNTGPATTISSLHISLLKTRPLTLSSLWDKVWVKLQGCAVKMFPRESGDSDDFPQGTMGGIKSGKAAGSVRKILREPSHNSSGSCFTSQHLSLRS